MKPKIAIVAVLLIMGLVGWKTLGTPTESGKAAVFYGNVDTRTVTLGFRFLGKITRMAKDEGESVHRDEPLAWLEDAKLHLSLAEAKADKTAKTAVLQKLRAGYRPEEIAQADARVAQAQASAADAHDAYRRQAKLMQSNATFEEKFIAAGNHRDMADAALKEAESALALMKAGYRDEEIRAQQALVAASEAKIAQVRQDLNDSVLLSPVDGVILSRYKEPGAIAGAGEAVFEIANQEAFWVRAYMDEPFLSRVKQGEPMKVSAGDDGPEYEGIVGFISPVAEFTPKTIQTVELRSDLVYRFRVIIQNPDDRLRQGMPVTVVKAKR